MNSCLNIPSFGVTRIVLMLALRSATSSYAICVVVRFMSSNRIFVGVSILRSRFYFDYYNFTVFSRLIILLNMFGGPISFARETCLIGMRVACGVKLFV